MNKKAVLLTIRDIINTILITVVYGIIVIGAGFLFLVAPYVAAWIFNFAIPDNTPNIIIYGYELMFIGIIIFVGFAIKQTYLDHKNNLEEKNN